MLRNKNVLRNEKSLLKLKHVKELKCVVTELKGICVQAEQGHLSGAGRAGAPLVSEGAAHHERHRLLPLAFGDIRGLPQTHFLTR